MRGQTTISLSAIMLICLQTIGVHAKDLPGSTLARPLAFTENKGQVTDQNYQPRTDIDFKMATPNGMNVFVGDGQLHYQWNKQPEDIKQGKNVTVETYRLDVVLVGANRDAVITVDEKQSGFDHFYQAHLGADGAMAYSYNRITYKDIYPNIDWVIYSKDNKLEYDFVVHPGGDPSVIKMQYAGATTLEAMNGGITVTTPYGSITEGKPYTYDAETKSEVPSAFVLNGNTLGFNVQPSNHAIVIDPVVNWATYYGGIGGDFSKGLKADASGNVYMSGYTSSSNNIVTTGTHQVTIGGSVDGFFVKFNAAGVRQWGTYYGGTGDDYFTSVAIESTGSFVYAAGIATSNNGIATAGAHIPTHISGANLMLVKFDASNGTRSWGTYILGDQTGGGNAFEGSVHIVCNGAGDIFMNHVPGGMAVSKFSSACAQYWSNTWTSGGYVAAGIALDGSGNIYPLAFGISNPNNYEVFWAKMLSSGIIDYTRTIGGTGWDAACGIDVDVDGNVYVSGETTTSTGIATSGTYRSTLAPGVGGPQFDGFLIKYNNAGTKQWGTYVGVGGGFRSTLAAGLGGKVYVGAVNNYSGASVYMHAFNTSNGTLNSSTTLPGSSHDNVVSLAYSPSGRVYMCGQTTTITGFATTGAHQTSPGGGKDGYLISFGVDTMVTVHEPFNDTVLCAGSTFKLPYDVTNTFASGNTFTAYLSDENGAFGTPVSIGSLSSVVADTIVCTLPVTATFGSGYRVRISSAAPVWVSETNAKDIRIDTIIVPAILTYTANPGTNVGPGRGVTFSTTLSGVGSTPTYQWYKNGVAISGATGATYAGVTTVDFNNGDAITVEVISNVACASPASVTSSPLVIAINTGVNEISKDGWAVFPNPTAGKLVLTGEVKGNAEIQVLNMAGQVVYANKVQANGPLTNEIVLDSKLANGMYLLRIATEQSVFTTRFSLEK